MERIFSREAVSLVFEENELLKEEVRVARRASEITAKLVVEQFVKTEKILRLLEETAANEKELRRTLSEKLAEAEERKAELARERRRLQKMQIAAINMMEDMAQAQRTAEIASRAKSEFLANMSHEIRTPMNAILGFTEILLEDIVTAPHKDYLSTIATSGQILLKLINDILDLSKIEAGRLELQSETINLLTVLNDIDQVFRQSAQEKGLAFNLNADAELNQNLILDEIRLRQILLNLVGNAVKFTDQGHVTVDVHIVDHPNTPESVDLVLSVGDSGIGIAPDQTDKIFEAFKQQSGQDAYKYGGTGLGLTITRRLVEMMNGDITVTSQPGQGSRFKVVLKNVPRSNEALPDTSDDAAILLDAVQFAPATLLIVDDIPYNRDLLKGYLKGMGFEILEAGNGIEAIEAATSRTPDLILMDMKLPGDIDGYEATRTIKQQPQLADKPLVAITASAMKPDVDRMQTFGCDSLLIKPISKKELIGILQRYLPHTCRQPAMRGSATPSAAKSGEGAQLGLEKLSDNARATLPAFLENLENDLSPKWDHIQSTFIFHDIQAFAEEIYDLARQHELMEIQKWADKLKQQSVNFDMERLPGTLAHFVEIRRSIRAFAAGEERS